MGVKLVQERAYWIAWSQLQGMGPTLIFRLSNHFGSLKPAWEASADELMAVDGIGEQIAYAILNGRSPMNPDELLEKHSQENPHFWTPADAEYPRLLLEIPDPPPVLYYRGQVNPDENRGLIPAIAIVGTRSPSDYGKRWTRRISHALAQAGITVVSGLADGIDAEAHKSCLKAGGRTVAVVGTGVNIVYPWTNRTIAKDIVQTGLILSEYPMGTKPDRTHFPRRNRIIAGLCRAILVLEAPERSGALITARLATDYNRDIYALPGSLDNDNAMGCLHLIHEGAQMILDEKQLLESLGALPHLSEQRAGQSEESRAEQRESHQSSEPIDIQQMSLVSSPSTQSEPLQSIQLEPDLDCVLQAIQGDLSSLDQIVDAANLPIGTVLAALVQLEILGLVAQQPGMMYQKC